MKKNVIIVMIFAIMLISTKCYAENAYSVGTNWGNDTYKPGYDYRQNVINAANAYHNLSGFNSYYSTEPTYSYIKSKNRLGGSSVFFINGHSSSEKIRVASKNAENYQTGISIHKDDWSYCSQKEGDWIYAGLDGRDMSKTKLITFAGCETAKGPNNLTKKAVEQGAKAAVGFLDSIYTTSDKNDINWLIDYNNSLGSGKNVMQAIIDANSNNKYSSLKEHYFLSGKGSTTLGTPKKSKSKNSNELLDEVFEEDLYYLSTGIHALAGGNTSEEIAPENDYVHLKIEDKISTPLFQLSKTNEINYNREHEIDIPLASVYKPQELIKILEIIKKYDSSFDEKDYKISYNFSDTVEKFGTISIDYYIDDTIQTNKAYMVVLMNGEVQDIILIGVKKENLDNIKSTDNTQKINQVSMFEKNIKESKIYEKASKFFEKNKILTSAKDINTANIEKNVKKVKERYLYDYNTQKLTYQLMLTIEEEGEVFDGQSIEIEIN